MQFMQIMIIIFYECVSVQQSSFYGYTSMLPRRYTQAVMTGESEYALSRLSPV